MKKLILFAAGGGILGFIGYKLYERFNPDMPRTSSTPVQKQAENISQSQPAEIPQTAVMLPSQQSPSGVISQAAFVPRNIIDSHDTVVLPNNQPAPTPVAMNWQKTTAAGFQAVAIAPNGTLWGCGSNGTIWYSVDKGKVWVKTVASGFMRVAANDNVVVGCGKNGTIWFSKDKGLTWTKTSASGMVDVAVSGNGVIYACGGNGTLWTAEKTGVWVKTNAEGMVAVACARETIYAVVNDGSVWYAVYKQDGKLDWRKTNASGVKQVAVDSRGIIWATREDGTVWLSTVEGIAYTTWNQTNAANVVFCGAGVTYIAVAKGDGSIWTAQTI